ncbi:MAG: OmpH family outer membrane protein [Alphaproteobacteria bacterium]|nr:OmpH family outer membrane protein [Alphaproteobacteria bacterium]
MPWQSMSVRTVIAVFVAVASMMSVNAAAQDIPPVKVAIVEMQRIQNEASAWKDLSQKLKAAQEKVLQDLQPQQSALEEEAKALQQQQAILAPEAFETKVAEFEQKRREMVQTSNERRQAVERALVEAKNRIIKEIRDILLGITEEKGYNLILDQSNADPTIVVASPEINITETVIKRLDQKLPTVEFSVPAQ